MKKQIHDDYGKICLHFEISIDIINSNVVSKTLEIECKTCTEDMESTL